MQMEKNRYACSTFVGTVSLGKLLGGGRVLSLVQFGYLDKGLSECRWDGDIKFGEEKWLLVE